MAADRLYRRVRTARFRLVTIGLAIIVPSLVFLARAESLDLAKAAAAGFGLGCGLFISNLFPSAFDVVPESVRASAVGWLNLLGGLVSGAAAYLGGEYRRSLGIPALMTVAAGLCLLGAVILAAAVRFFFERDHQRLRTL
jgi:ABC-type enterochelin transport system permease subunit